MDVTAGYEREATAKHLANPVRPRLSEVVIGLQDFAKRLPRWNALLGTNKGVVTDSWRLSSDGPLLRVVPNDSDDLIELVLDVDSPEAISRFEYGRARSDPLDGLPLTCRMATSRGTS